MPKASPSKRFLLGIILLITLAAGIPLTLSQSQVQQILTGNAWNTSQSATAVCTPTSANVFIKVSFKNQESNRSMLVKALDTQSGKSVDLGTINAGTIKTGQIDTQRTSLNSGQVVFKLAWTDAPSQTDTRNAGYSQVSKCTPLTTPSPSTQPTQTPSPTTAKPTPTPTAKPTPTPTKPAPTQTPSPTTAKPTTCPTPGTVKNIKIQCPYCTPSPNPNQ